jgi:hypothetical protein
MTKLTDTQLIVLSSASKHDEGLATRPINLHAAAAQKVASSLINKGLAREIRAKADAPVWHENGDGRFALKITRAGREAIGVDEEEAEDAGSSASPPPSKSKKAATKAAGAKGTAKKSEARTRSAAPRKSGAEEALSVQLRPGSKQAIIVDLMMRPKGAALDDLIAATDWLPHTTRAALTGLRKRGYTVERTRGEDKITRYRATPPTGSASESKQEPAATPAESRAKAA